MVCEQMLQCLLCAALQNVNLKFSFSLLYSYTGFDSTNRAFAELG